MTLISELWAPKLKSSSQSEHQPNTRINVRFCTSKLYTCLGVPVTTLCLCSGSVKAQKHSVRLTWLKIAVLVFVMTDGDSSTSSEHRWKCAQLLLEKHSKSLQVSLKISTGAILTPLICLAAMLAVIRPPSPPSPPPAATGGQ